MNFRIFSCIAALAAAFLSSGCGKKPLSSLTVIGDMPAAEVVEALAKNIGTLTYVDSLRQISSPVCKAIFINNSEILTATHCLIQNTNTRSYYGILRKPENFKVSVHGSNELLTVKSIEIFNPQSGHLKDEELADIMSTHNYYTYDIARLTLDTAIHKNIPEIEVFSDIDAIKRKLKASQKLSVFTFGNDQNNKEAGCSTAAHGTLAAVELELIGISDSIPFPLHAGLKAEESKKEMCRGDSGGPTFIFDEGKYKLFGINSVIIGKEHIQVALPAAFLNPDLAASLVATHDSSNLDEEHIKISSFDDINWAFKASFFDFLNYNHSVEGLTTTENGLSDLLAREPWAEFVITPKAFQLATEDLKERLGKYPTGLRFINVKEADDIKVNKSFSRTQAVFVESTFENNSKDVTLELSDKVEYLILEGVDSISVNSENSVHSLTLSDPKDPELLLKNLDQKFKHLKSLYLDEAKGLGEMVSAGQFPKSLETLSISGSKLKSITNLSVLKKLKGLGLTHNSIESDAFLDEITSYSIPVYLNGNPLQKSSVCQDTLSKLNCFVDPFPNPQNIVEWCLNNQNIYNLGAPLIWGEPLLLWQKLYSVLSPNGDYTALEKSELCKDEFEKLSTLTELNLAAPSAAISDSYSMIRILDGLQFLPNLQTLNLSDNLISDLAPLSGMKNLRNLYIGRNKIRDLSPLSALSQLEVVALGHNQVHDLSPLAPLHNLRQIIAIYNRIEEVPASMDGKNYKVLALDGNPIKK